MSTCVIADWNRQPPAVCVKLFLLVKDGGYLSLSVSFFAFFATVRHSPERVLRVAQDDTGRCALERYDSRSGCPLMEAPSGIEPE